MQIENSARCRVFGEPLTYSRNDLVDLGWAMQEACYRRQT